MLYNGLLKNSEMLFSDDSKFYIQDSHAYVRFSLKTSANFTMQYQEELSNEFFNLFDFKEHSVTSGFVFMVSELMERVLEDRRGLFVYLIFKTMFMKKICPDFESLKIIDKKVVRYQKKKFMKLLIGLPRDFVNSFQSEIYTAIVDSMGKVLDIETNDLKYHKYAYKTTLVAKEYLDDLEAYIKNEQNSGYPRVNKMKMEERPFESALKLAEKIKNK